MDNEITREEFTKKIFGRADRLTIWGTIKALRIKPPKPFFSNQIAHELDISTATVHNEIIVLQRLGMIEPYAEAPEYPNRGQKPAWYVRTSSPAWRIVGAAINAEDILFPKE